MPQTQRATPGCARPRGCRRVCRRRGSLGWGAPEYLSATPAPLRSPWLQKHPQGCSLKTGTSRAQGTEVGVRRGFPRTVPDPAGGWGAGGAVLLQRALCLVLTLLAGLSGSGHQTGVCGQQLLLGLTQEALEKHPPSQTPQTCRSGPPRAQHCGQGAGCWVGSCLISTFLVLHPEPELSCPRQRPSSSLESCPRVPVISDAQWATSGSCQVRGV